MTAARQTWQVTLRGVRATSVTMARPSLDEVYLRYAGRAYSEANGGPEASHQPSAEPETSHRPSTEPEEVAA